jgi:hypothetical protein
MHKTLIEILLSLWLVLQGEAQHFQFTGNAGYATPSFLRVTNGEYHIAGNICSGVAAAFTKKSLTGFAKNSFLEIQYNYQRTSFRYDVYNSDLKYELGHMQIHTLLAGILKELNDGEPKFFGSLLMGLTIYDPDDLPNLTRFTFSITGGMKIPVSKIGGFRVQTQLILPIIYDEVYVGWEPGFGLTTGVAVNGIVFIPQFTGGFYFNIGTTK